MDPVQWPKLTMSIPEAAKGIFTIDYKSGTHRSIEVAVRDCVLGGLGLMDEKICQQNHDDLGCDGWEISAHRASAPDHEPIQGKQYTDAQYKSLNNSLRRRIGTLHCGHSAMGIIMGVNEPQYTPEELEELRRENEEGVTYDGQQMTLYQATQRQRSLERKIRKQKKNILLDEALEDEEQLQTDQIRYQVLSQEYKRFSKATGQKLRHERLEAAGFGPKQAKAAEKAAQERINSVGEAAATANWHRIPVAGGQTNTMYRKVKSPRINTADGTAANRIIDENVRRTNPGYMSGKPSYRQNCQRCVAAYEMRRRGYDVIAKPAVVGDDGKISTKDPLYKSWRNIFEGAKFEFHSGFDGGKSSIISRMESWGDGAVAEVRVLWNQSEAHVFIAERVNGTVRFIDPQNGDLNCERYFTNATLGATMIARIDNLEPSALIEKCIKNRGGK